MLKFNKQAQPFILKDSQFVIKSLMRKAGLIIAQRCDAIKFYKIKNSMISYDLIYQIFIFISVIEIFMQFNTYDI